MVIKKPGFWARNGRLIMFYGILSLFILSAVLSAISGGPSGHFDYYNG